MPAKKKPAKKPARHQKRHPAEALVENLAADLQRVLAERDEARKELAEARRGREAWCHKAVECEQRAEHAEEQLKVLLAGITAQRPSVASAFAPRPSEPGPTYGLPGDAPLPRPTTRFSREFRG